MPVHESAFEAEHFGGRVWRYMYSADPNPVQVARMAKAEKVKLVWCRVAENDSEAAAALRAAGFRLIEQLVTLDRGVEPPPAVQRSVVRASPADRAACVDIATAALRQDRYHADPAIDDRIADAIKAAWVSNNLAGRAEMTLVARDEAGCIVGFNQLLRSGSMAVIDLIAVDPSAQQRGYGRALVAAGLSAYGGHADTMRVGTQATNAASLALYRSVGFQEARRESTYHIKLGR